MCLQRAIDEDRSGNIYALQPVLLHLATLFPEALGRVEAVFAEVYARRAVDAFSDVPVGNGAGGAPSFATASATASPAANARLKMQTVFKILTHQLAPPCPVHGSEDFSPDATLLGHFGKYLVAAGGEGRGRLNVNTYHYSGHQQRHSSGDQQQRRGLSPSNPSAMLCLCELAPAAWLPIMALDKKRRERFNQNLTLFCEAMKEF